MTQKKQKPVEEFDIVDNEKEIENVLEKTLKILNKSKLDIRQLILFYGNLGYIIGCSMAGFKEQGPNLETLKKEYYSNPTVDIGFMLQGLLITSWEHSWKEKPVISDLSKRLSRDITNKEIGEK